MCYAKHMLCLNCKQEFRPKRSTAKFCSAKCRVYAKRKIRPSKIATKSFHVCKNGHPLDSRGKCFGKGCKYGV